jgi:hypothetical protein
VQREHDSAAIGHWKDVDRRVQNVELVSLGYPRQYELLPEDTRDDRATRQMTIDEARGTTRPANFLRRRWGAEDHPIVVGLQARHAAREFGHVDGVSPTPVRTYRERIEADPHRPLKPAAGRSACPC